ncbi:terminase family protein [Shewanella baltica]|uniref:terminase large subunit domain-containing protein n=1 Tax=Shewanella baltica TaxID=62322 RepID=UPI0030D61E86
MGISTLIDVRHITKPMFDNWLKTLFSYQTVLHKNINQHIRNTLKFRVGGFTEYFVCEAFEKAVLTGKNQIFFTCETEDDSYSTALYCRDILTRFVAEYFGIKLCEGPIRLLTQFGVVRILFVDKNMRYFGGWSGDVYFDEYFFNEKFEYYRKIATGIAFHKRYTQTFYSSVNDDNSAAKRFWFGDDFIDLTHYSLSSLPPLSSMRDGGRLCSDKQWRYVVTVEDALDGGCDFFDIDELRNAYSVDEFNQLYMCNLKR